MRSFYFVCMAVLLSAVVPAVGETLPALADGAAPQSYQELWSGFDPRAEPLETEVLHEWEEDRVTLRVVRFRIGVFRGRTAWLASCDADNR